MLPLKKTIFFGGGRAVSFADLADSRLLAIIGNEKNGERQDLRIIIFFLSRAIVASLLTRLYRLSRISPLREKTEL